MTIMQEVLQHLPPSFTQAPDPKRANQFIKLQAATSEDRSKLTLMAVDVSNTTFLGAYGEREVAPMKGDGSWPHFFKEMEMAFTGRKVTVTPKGQRLACSWESTAGTVTFDLPLSSDPPSSGPSRLLHALCEFYFWRQGNDGQQRISELTKKEQELQRKVTALETERSGLMQIIQQVESEEKLLEEDYRVLQEELQELTRKRHQQLQEMGKDPQLMDEAAPIEPSFGTNLGRVPLGGETLCRVFDIPLVQMIREQLRPEDDEEMDSSGRAYVSGICTPPTSEALQQVMFMPEARRQQVLNTMQKLQEWDFDVWTIQDMTAGALFYTAYALFLHWNMLRRFNIDPQIAFNFFSQVEAGYHPNPYHNCVHAADVMHIVHYILGPGELKEIAQLTDEDVLAALIASMIHDYDHPGLNNNYHIKTQNYLATLYNDRSILENHHLAEVFDLMQNDQLNLLHGLSEPQYRDCRETIIEMVLATDMGLHAKILGTWKRRIGQDHNLESRKEDQRLALAMGIKMADISNCGRPQPFYLRWSYKLCEEFFLQGDDERSRGDNVSPFMDRCSPSMSRSQIAFMNYVVIPMFESISEFLPAMHFSVDICEQNKRYWATNDDSL